MDFGGPLDDYDGDDVLLGYDRVAQEREESEEGSDVDDQYRNELDLLSEDENITRQPNDKQDADEGTNLTKELDRLKLAQESVEEDILRIMKELGDVTACLKQTDPRITKASQPSERTKASLESIYIHKRRLQHFATLIQNGHYYIGLESDVEIDTYDDDVSANIDCEMYFSEKDIVLVVKPPVIDSVNIDIYQPKHGRHLTLSGHIIDEIDVVTQTVSFKDRVRIFKATSYKLCLSVENGFDAISETNLDIPSALMTNVMIDYDFQKGLLFIYYDKQDNLIHYLNYLHKTLPPECKFACTTEYINQLPQIRKQLSNEIKMIKGLFNDISDFEPSSQPQSDSEDADATIPGRKPKKTKIDYIDFRRRLMQLEIKNDYAMSRLPDV